jgi:ariadne-1
LGFLLVFFVLQRLTREFLAAEWKMNQAALESRLYSCSICFDDVKIDEVYLFDCGHRFCKSCSQDHVKAQLQQAKEITCPSAPACEHKLSFLEIQQLTDAETVKKLDSQMLESALAEDPSIVWCPKPDCGCAMSVEDLEQLAVTCAKCQFKFCRSCRVEWHADTTCRAYQRWAQTNGQADAKFDAWAKRNARVCPHCHRWIVKTGGCNHMTCKSCRQEFCWACGGKWLIGHICGVAPSPVVETLSWIVSQAQSFVLSMFMNPTD